MYVINYTFNNAMRIYISKRIDIGSNLNYRYTTRVVNGIKKNICLWNLYASIQLFHNSRGFLKFWAFDILDSSPEMIRTIGENYVEDVQVSRQRRNYTLSFQYNWNKSAKNKTEN